jgi:hypothetical protein
MKSSLPPIAAFAWAVLFALPSLLWAAGETFGEQTIARDPEAALGWGAEPWALVLVAAAKIAAGVWAIVVARHPTRLAANLTFLLGAGLLLYGLANGAQHALMAMGVVAAPETVGETAVRWHLLLWDPVWIAGGVFFSLTGWRARAESR